jgi:hypothetical protein
MTVFARLLWTAAVLLTMQGCRQRLIELPEVDDPLFSHVAGVQLGMSKAAFQRLGREVFVMPDGNVQEFYGPGFIEYNFEGAATQRLVAIRWWFEYSDSLHLMNRWTDLVSGIEETHRGHVRLQTNTRPGMRERRALWDEEPRLGVSAQILADGGPASYRGELVVIVRMQPWEPDQHGQGRAGSTQTPS